MVGIPEAGKVSAGTGCWGYMATLAFPLGSTRFSQRFTTLGIPTRLVQSHERGGLGNQAGSALPGLQRPARISVLQEEECVVREGTELGGRYTCLPDRRGGVFQLAAPEEQDVAPLSVPGVPAVAVADFSL